MTTIASSQPVIPRLEEQVSLAQVGALLQKTGSGQAILVGPDHQQTVLSGAALEVLRQAVAELAKGHAVTVIPTSKELTTQQAAGILNVSRPYLIQLLETGKIPFRRVGTHRRIALSSVLDYGTDEAVRRAEILDKMVWEAQEMGEYTA
jgi:excisionase family DNA binding protein